MNTSVVRTLLFLAVSAGSAAGCAQATPDLPQDMAGRWLTESGNLEVDIAPCGEAFCGTVTRVIANRSMSEPNAAMTPADARNPLGTKILWDLVISGDGEWRGQIYNRENGKIYDCVVSLASRDHLKLRGYIGIPLIGKTQVWTRVGPQAKP